MPRFFSINPSLLFSLILSSLLLSACATPVEDQAANPTPEQTEKRIEEVVEDIPERELGEEAMALLLEAEFALYRQNVERALDIYEKLAAETGDVGVAKRTAEIALANNDPFRALDDALLYLELAPEDNFAVELAVRALARSAEIEGAWELLNQHPDKTYELRMMAAEAVRLAGQMEDNYQIEWLLEQMLEKYGDSPDDPETQLAFGLIYEALGNYQTAATYAAQAHHARPDNLLALRLHANSLLRVNRPDGASAVLSEWINTHTDNSEARISLAQMIASFDPDAALPIMEMLSAEYPWAGQLLMATAQLHLASDTPEVAIPYYEQLTQFGIYRNLSLFNLGRIYQQIGELERASEYYGSVGVDERGDNEQDLLFEAGVRQASIEYTLGNSGAIIFEKLRQLYPDQSSGLIHEEARLLIDAGSFDAAIALLSAGIDEDSSSEPLLYTRSIAHERSGDVDAAIEDLQTILSFDDSNSVALNALGYTLANRTNRYFEAYDLIDRALSISPEDPATMDSMGWVLFHLGRYEEALGFLQQAHSAMLDEEVIAHLAEVLAKLERFDDAKEILQQGSMDLPGSDLIPKTRTKLGFDS